MEQKQQVNFTFEQIFKRTLDEHKLDLKKLLLDRLNDQQITHQFYMELNEEITDIFIGLNNSLNGIMKKTDERINILEKLLKEKK